MRLVPVGQRTFALLAAIEVAISGLAYGLRRDALEEVLSRFVLKFAMLSVVLTAVTFSGTWLPIVLNGFAAAGERAVGQTGITDPSEVIDLGASIAGQMMSIMDGWGIVRHPVLSLYSAICAVIVFLSYVYIAAQLLVVLVDSYILVAQGALFLAGAAFRMTAGYAEGLLNRVVYIGTKIFLLYVVVATGVELSRGWPALLAADPSFAAGSPVWQIIGGAVVFALLTKRIPNTGGGMITAHPSLGIAAAMRAL